MIQVGTRQANRPFLSGQSNPGVGTEVFAALIADRFTVRDKHFQFFGFVSWRFHSQLLNWSGYRALLAGQPDAPPRENLSVG